MHYAKAILAGVVALVGGIAVGYTDDSLTKGEFWAAASAAVVALASVFGVPNQARAEDGNAEVTMLLLVGTFIGVVLLLCGVKFD